MARCEIDTELSWGRLETNHKFNPHIVAEKLAARCSSLRADLRCTLAVEADSGSEHVMKLIDFEDGKKWVARLHSPACEQPGRFASSWEMRVSSEVATHGLIQQETNIPVPKVHDFDGTTEKIGWPFVLMEFMPGTPALIRLQNATPEQYSHFLRQMAKIQIKLANVRRNKIGSVVRSSTGFEVGLDLETAHGPFDKPKQYYQAVASHRHTRCVDHRSDRMDEFGGEDPPAMFGRCIESIDKFTEESFGLANRDLGPHNLLIDNNFNVKAMIDLDFVQFAPEHLVAMMPNRYWSGLDLSSLDPKVSKRVEEYLNALKVDRPGFLDIIRSPLAKFWVELESLDLNFDTKEPVRVGEVLSIMSLVKQGLSFLEGGKGKTSGVQQ